MSVASPNGAYVNRPLLRRLTQRKTLTLAAAAISIIGIFTAPAAADGQQLAGPTQVQTRAGTMTATYDEGGASQLHQFWTPERIEKALAHPLQPPARSSHTHADSNAGTPALGSARTVEAHSVPPKGQVTSQSAAADAIAAAAEVTRSERVPYSTSWPTVAVGELLIATNSDGDVASCSATSIVSSTKNAVWTAGHCLHQGAGGSSGFYKGFLFLPAYYKDNEPWGGWGASRVIVPDNWGNNGDLLDSDMGALVVYDAGGEGYGNLQDEIGAFGYRFDGGTGISDVYSWGYPADGYNRPASDFSGGEYLMYCYGNTIDNDDWNPIDDRLRMDCDMGHGASGGPMVIGVADGNIRIVGVNSHRHVDDSGNWTDNYLFSSNHGNTAAAVIDLLNNG
jgi:V8-like Glu-specific endopeptidase